MKCNVLLHQREIIRKYGHAVSRDTGDYYFNFGSNRSKVHDTLHSSGLLRRASYKSRDRYEQQIVKPKELEDPLNLTGVPGLFSDFPIFSHKICKEDIVFDYNDTSIRHVVIGLYLEPTGKNIIKNRYATYTLEDAELIDLQSRDISEHLMLTAVQIKTSWTYGGIM